MTQYRGWSSVPAHLTTKSAVADLEYPRSADGVEPAAWVEARGGWRGKEQTFALYDVHACPPTGSTGAQLRAAAGRENGTSSRLCEDCGAHCQRSLTAVGEGADRRVLCPACRHIALLRERQAVLAQHRAATSADVARLVSCGPVAVVQVDVHEPPLTDSGRRRPATAARVRACGLDGRRLLDVTVRLVGPRSKWVPEGAVDQAEALPRVRAALAGRRLVTWSAEELRTLREVDPDGGHPSARDGEAWAPLLDQWVGRDLSDLRASARAVIVGLLAAQWRGELDPRTRQLVPCVAPGSPDRLALMLDRMAEAARSVASSG